MLLCHQHIRCSAICIINEPYIFIIKKKFAERNVDHKTPKVIFSQTLQEDPVLELLFRFWIFYYPSFLSQTLTIHRTARERRRRFLSHSATFIRSRTFRHLFTTLHVRWLSRIFNRNACACQAATRWDLPLSNYHLIELPFDWLLDDAMFVCLLDELILAFCYSDLTWETGGFELASTITLALQANWLTKWASHPIFIKRTISQVLSEV